MGRFYAINGMLKISRKDKLVSGDNLKINSAGYHNPAGGYRKTVLATEQSGYIEIGNTCGISDSLVYSVGKIVLEDHVMIGSGCSI